MGIVQIANGFLNGYSIVSFFVGLLPGGYFVYKLVSFLVRKEIRLFSNLKRNIYLMTTSTANSLQREKVLLQENGLYRVHDEVLNLSDLGVLDTVNKFSTFVIAYSKEFTYYQKVVDRAKRDLIPIIFLANPGEISNEHMAIFKEYPYFEMCNTSARLLTTIFNLSVITPNEKR